MTQKSTDAVRSRGRETGFTLVELLVAASITVALAGLLSGVAGKMIGVWSRAHSRMAAEVQAQRVLDQLEVDLQGVLAGGAPGVWLSARVQPDPDPGASGCWVNGAKPAADSLGLAPADIREARFGMAGVWLRFFSSIPGQASGTDQPPAPVAVSYQIIRRPPTPGSKADRYLLYRAEASPAATFGAGYDLGGADYATPDTADGSVGSLVSPRHRKVIAEHVVDFGVRFLGQSREPSISEDALVTVFPVSGGPLDCAAGQADPSEAPVERMPAAVDVMLRILSEEGARRIAAVESGRSTGDWWTIVEANSFVFSRRIFLPVGGE